MSSRTSKRSIIEYSRPIAEKSLSGGIFLVKAVRVRTHASFSKLSTGTAGNLSLGDMLGADYGSYEKWGFTLDSGTLKFKKLA